MRMTMFTFMLLCCVLAVPTRAQSFEGLGLLPDQSMSKATDLSTDGSTVIGDSRFFLGGGAGTPSWRWRSTSGLESLGSQPAFATRVSRDGSSIVGYGLEFLVFRWREGAGAEEVTASGSNGTTGPGLSDDGDVVVGRHPQFERAMTWTSAGGAVELPLLADDNPTVYRPQGGHFAFAANFDGSVVVGTHYVRKPTDSSNTLRNAPCVWTPAGAQILLDNGQIFEGNAYDTSVSGDTVLALSILTPNTLYRWTQATGYQPALGLQINFNFADPRLSGNGNTIISLDKVWTQSRGAVPITQLLTEAGSDFSGWSTLYVTGVNYDGTIFAGYGTNPTGQTEAWYATIPSPASAAPLLALLATLTHPRRRR